VAIRSACFRSEDGRDADLRVTDLEAQSRNVELQRSVATVRQDIDGHRLEVFECGRRLRFRPRAYGTLTSNKRAAASVRLFSSGQASPLRRMCLRSQSAADDVPREDWLGPRGHGARQQAARTTLSFARLRQNAVVEDADLHTPRGLDRGLFQTLTTCSWIRDSHHVLIGGPTGVGKSWLVCALGHKACRDGFSVLYRRHHTCSPTSPPHAVRGGWRA
jgi:hypothetical protein